MNLESIIAALLHDLADAQDQANRASAALSSQYRQDSILQYFPVPNALIEEADITLRFAVDSVETIEPGPGRPGAMVTPPRAVMADVAAGLASIVLAELRGRIDTDDQLGARPMALELRRQLWMPAIRSALTQNLTSFLYPVLTLYCLEPRDFDRVRETGTALQDALVATFGEDRDLAASVGRTEDWARLMAGGAIGDRAVSGLTDAAANWAAGRDDGEAAAVINIRLGPDLGDIPESLIQTVRLQARLRNYKWVIEQQDIGQKDQLVPES